MAWDDISDLSWLHPRGTPGDALVKGVQAGSSIASNWLRGRAISQERDQFNAQLAERKRQFELELPVKLMTEQVRLKYQENAAASNLLKLMAMEAKSSDQPKLEASMAGLTKAFQEGPDAIMSHQPEPFGLIASTKLYNDAKIKLARESRGMAKQKAYEQLTGEQQARLRDIWENQVLSHQGRVVAEDAVYAEAEAQRKASKAPFTTAQSNIDYAKKIGALSPEEEIQAAKRAALGPTANDDAKRKEFIDRSRITAINKRIGEISKEKAELKPSKEPEKVMALQNERKNLERELQGFSKPNTAQANKPASPSSGVRVKNKETGQTFIYKGNASDIPTEQFEILQ